MTKSPRLRLVQQIGNVNNHRGQDVGNRHDIIQHFLVVNRFSFVEVHQLEVVIFHHFFQFISEGCFIKQIANAQTATSDFIFVSRADTATGGTDSFRATRFFTRDVQRHVIIEDKRAGLRAADAREQGYHGLPDLSSLSSAQPETARHRYR
jgi:hypothetical protein